MMVQPAAAFLAQPENPEAVAAFIAHLAGQCDPVAHAAEKAAWPAEHVVVVPQIEAALAAKRAA